METKKIELAIWRDGVKFYRGDFSSEINSISAFKRKVKDILMTDYAKDILGISENKRIKIFIGRWYPLQEIIVDWTNLSKLPKDFLKSENYVYFISLG